MEIAVLALGIVLGRTRFESLLIDSAMLASHGDADRGQSRRDTARMGALEPAVGRVGRDSLFVHAAAEAQRGLSRIIDGPSSRAI